MQSGIWLTCYAAILIIISENKANADLVDVIDFQQEALKNFAGHSGANHFFKNTFVYITDTFFCSLILWLRQF